MVRAAGILGRSRKVDDDEGERNVSGRYAGKERQGGEGGGRRVGRTTRISRGRAVLMKGARGYARDRRRLRGRREVMRQRWVSTQSEVGGRRSGMSVWSRP